MGDGLKAGTTTGPLINEEAVAKVEEHIADVLASGGQIVAGGKRHALGGTFFEPTVITAVAANVGGVEVLLSGRPGSWEADYVRQIVQSTAGDDDTELLRYRTEPVRIEFDAEEAFDDFGLTGLYERDVDELATRSAAADDALFEAYVTAEERARIEEIRAATTNVIGTDDDALFERSKPLMEEAQAIVEAITQRAVAADDPLAAALTAAETAEEMTRRLAREEGIFAGISSGGALAVALRLAAEVENATIVTIVCDRGDRYLSTGVFPA